MCTVIFQIMAVAYKYTIISLTLLLRESLSSSNSINRDLCLETVARFRDDQHKCSFDKSAADDILQNVTTCPKKCKFRMHLLYGNTNSLRQIDLTIGTWKKRFHPCTSLRHSHPIYLYINCSLWNAREYIIWDGFNACCRIDDAQCVRIYYYCICHCMPGYILVNKRCFKKIVNIGGICKFNWQCNGTEFANVCDHAICACSPGYIQLNKTCYMYQAKLHKCKCRQCGKLKKCSHSELYQTRVNKNNTVKTVSIVLTHFCCGDKGIIAIPKKTFTAENYPGNLTLNDPCELTEQCMQPFSVCFQGKCQCINGYSALNRESCFRDTVPVGGFCNLHEQCTGSNNSGVCENGRCTCTKGMTITELECETNQPNSRGWSDSQQHDVNIGVTLGTLFGGFILGVFVTAVVTILMYKRLKFRITKREDIRVMFSDNRAYGCAGFDDSGAQISNRNDKKQNVATLSSYSSAKQTQGYNLSSKQDDERTEHVYNHLREQTEHDDDTYDYACVVPNHSTDLSDYSNIHDAATFRPSPSKDGDDYSTLEH